MRSPTSAEGLGPQAARSPSRARLTLPRARSSLRRQWTTFLLCRRLNTPQLSSWVSLPKLCRAPPHLELTASRADLLARNRTQPGRLPRPVGPVRRLPSNDRQLLLERRAGPAHALGQGSPPDLARPESDLHGHLFPASLRRWRYVLRLNLVLSVRAHDELGWSYEPSLGPPPASRRSRSQLHRARAADLSFYTRTQ